MLNYSVAELRFVNILVISFASASKLRRSFELLHLLASAFTLCFCNLCASGLKVVKLA